MTIHSTVGDLWRFYTGKGNTKIYSQCFVKERLEESKSGGQETTWEATAVIQEKDDVLDQGRSKRCETKHWRYSGTKNGRTGK